MTEQKKIEKESLLRIIFREEELLKSVLHECIHYFKLDFGPFDYPNNLIDDFYEKYNIERNNYLRPSEAYTETLANILNIICVMVENKFKISKINFGKLLDIELRF